MEVLKQLRKRFENVNNSVSRWAVGLMFLFMVAAPIELEAQSGLKISSLSKLRTQPRKVLTQSLMSQNTFSQPFWVSHWCS